MRKLKDKFFLYYQKNNGKNDFPVFLKLFLSPISGAWKCFSSIKNTFYDYEWIKTQKVKSCVVSIGNIQLGGTGKTPFLLFLAKQIKDRRFAILSRGYKSLSEHNALSKQINTLENISSDWIGDEPYLLKQELAESILFIGKNRVFSAREAEKQNIKLLFLDDGFQYRKLKRDIDIVLINEEILNSKSLFLGNFRETIKNLKRAHLVVIHSFDPSYIQPLKIYVQSICDVPIVVMKTTLDALYKTQETKVVLPSKKIALFCSIAHPENFKKLLTDQNLEVVEECILGDHEKMTILQMQKLAQKAKEKDACCLICTQKDRVKYLQELQLALPIYFTKTKMEIVEGYEEFDKILKTIHQLSNQS
jgi:tetraacyldisaccharide 4'-kinase